MVASEGVAAIVAGGVVVNSVAAGLAELDRHHGRSRRDDLGRRGGKLGGSCLYGSFSYLLPVGKTDIRWLAYSCGSGVSLERAGTQFIAKRTWKSSG
jgi:hypothetical protein